MKKIYLDVAGKMHSLYNELVHFPPEGYEFVVEHIFLDKVSKNISNIDFIYSLQKNALSKLIPVNLAKAYLERFKKIPEDVDLTYSTGHLVFRKEPWVVDFEFVTQLTGYNIKHLKKCKKLVERTLASEYCKGIICWTEASKKTVLGNLDCSKFEQKIEVVPLAVRKKNFTKSYNKDKVKLLFVGSSNIIGEFELRGGKETLEAFIHLNKKYDNTELVIRSDVSMEIKERYSQIENIRIIDKVIPWKLLEQEFKSADIFILPAHSSQDVAVLDAMSYELPVITSNVWANPEWVQDGITGFIINYSDPIPHYVGNFIPNWSSLQCMNEYKKVNGKAVDEIIKKLSILIEDEELRRKMGKSGRREIEEGKFSLRRRNAILKKIFDDITGG